MAIIDPHPEHLTSLSLVFSLYLSDSGDMLFFVMCTIIVFILYINILIVLILYMDKMNFECAVCEKVLNLSKMEALEHIRKHGEEI